jgi:hypothetical protein
MAGAVGSRPLLRTVTENGPSEWSPPVTIVAH